MNSVKCIKCGQLYESPEPDPYYCSSCEAEKKALAQEIDERLSSRPKKERPPSGLEVYDSLPKGPGGFVDAKHFL